ncbi:hypothetical protein RTG_00602 [Rhodotorula toruloides ATCC 204091]|uniref:DUF7719 domain-containing protein n=1 Tax=Rhodotorula toruloides TaxID=5286 RepID=A0A0K3CSU0_RHOTO|nr:hypothetical protein RTG_00602 [Rhodotorula toruloides ATCC 204091]KAK4335413.1 hypothetical protein RTBOTA2_004188 [Rhodotorula toruloides]PRQ71531.1 hypothetical protein AAT19DRAFT_10389 [Rhodotorula toruloides]
MAEQRSQTRTKSSKAPSAASWSPSPSPSPPSSPSTRSPDLSLSHADRLKLFEQHGPMRPSELGLPNGKDRDKDPMVVFSPEELERLVQQQQLAGSEGADAVKEAINGTQVEEEPADEAEDLMLWEEIVNAILWTVPFGFLFTGMDYAVHAQFGQELVPREEFTRLLNFLPALLLLNFLISRPSSRALLPPTVLQSALTVLSISTGISTIQTCTSEGYLRVMSRAPALGVVWCWTIVRLELGWSILALAGVGLGVWARGGDMQWLKGLV